MNVVHGSGSLPPNQFAPNGALSQPVAIVPSNLMGLMDDVEKCISSHESYDLKQDDLSEAIVINLASSNLDTDIRKVWEPGDKQLVSVLYNQQSYAENRAKSTKRIFSEVNRLHADHFLYPSGQSILFGLSINSLPYRS